MKRALLLSLVAGLALAGCQQPQPQTENAPDQTSSKPAPTLAQAWSGTVGDRKVSFTLGSDGNIVWKEDGKEKNGRGRMEGNIVYLLINGDNGATQGMELTKEGDALKGEYTDESGKSVEVSFKQDAL